MAGLNKITDQQAADNADAWNAGREQAANNTLINDMVLALVQYGDDLTYPPAPDSIDRRRKMIKELINRAEGHVDLYLEEPGAAPIPGEPFMSMDVAKDLVRKFAADASAMPDILTALRAIVDQTTVGKPGSMTLRSRYGSYPATLYHQARAAIAKAEASK